MSIFWRVLAFSLQHWGILVHKDWTSVLTGIPSFLFSLPILPYGMGENFKLQKEPEIKRKPLSGLSLK